jgi:hypothetical protein
MFHLIRHRKCSTCGQDLNEGDEVYQIEVDDPDCGFTYIHKTCMWKKKPDYITYKW